MKKVAFLSIVFSLTFSFLCYGLDNTYKIKGDDENILAKDINITINTDDFDFVCVNDEFMSLNSDYNFEDIFQISKEEYLNIMSESDLRFDAFDFDNFAEIYVKTSENTTGALDLNIYSEDELYQIFKDGAQSYFDDIGATELATEIVNINDCNYVYTKLLSGTTYVACYYTIQMGTDIWVSLNMPADSNTDYYTAILSQIANSIEYGDLSITTASTVPSRQTTSNEFLSGAVNTVIVGCISGAIMGTIAVLINRIRKHKKNIEENTNNSPDNSDNSVDLNVIQNNEAEQSDLCDSDEIELDAIEEKALEYSLYVQKLISSYKPKLPAMCNIYCEIDAMILAAFLIRYIGICAIKCKIEKIDRFSQVNRIVLKTIISESYGFSEEESASIIYDRISYYDNALMEEKLLFEDGLKLILEKFYHITVHNKNSNKIEYNFSGNSSMHETYSSEGFDFFSAVMDIFTILMKTASEELTDIKSILE